MRKGKIWRKQRGYSLASRLGDEDERGTSAGTMLACPMLCIDLVPEPAVFIPRYQHFVRRQPQTDSWLAGQFGAPNRTAQTTF